MIKVLFFIETLGGGGAEKVLCDLVNHMDQSKFDITVETLWPCEESNRLAKGIRYKSVYRSRSRLNQFRMRMESALGLVYRLHMKDDYDIEIAYLEMGSTKIIASSTNKRAKKVAWVHCDLAIRVADVNSFVKAASLQYRMFDRIVCVSEGGLQSYINLFGNNPPACVIYNTIDDRVIKELSCHPLPLNAERRRFTVVTVGRLTYQKAYERLIEIHKRLIGDGYKYDMWIVGDGELRNTLEKIVNESGLGDSVKLWGFQMNPYPFIKAADLLICSSRSEGLSTFVTEGLILGKPIIATCCAGMRDLLGDSEYGIITENSLEGLYTGLKQCLDDPEMLAGYAIKAGERGKAFSAQALTRKTELFLEDLVSVL